MARDNYFYGIKIKLNFFRILNPQDYKINPEIKINPRIKKRFLINLSLD